MLESALAPSGETILQHKVIVAVTVCFKLQTIQQKQCFLMGVI